MKQILLLALLVTATSGCAQQPPARRATPSDFSPSRTAAWTGANSFDFYLLNLSWSPEFCHSHPDATECAQHPAFVLHGLWPERTDGTYPQNCSDASGPAKPAEYADIYPDSGLLRHEWRAHGTCSGLNPDAYFETARTAYKSIKIPAKLSQLAAPLSMPPGDIAALFRQSNPGLPVSSIVISCGNNYLTAVEVCLDKSLHAVSCGAVRSCRANTVRIPNP